MVRYIIWKMATGATTGGPSRLRIQALSEKLASLRVTVDPRRPPSPRKVVADEQRLYDERVSRVRAAEETKIKMLREQIVTAQEQIGRERVARER